MKPVFTRLFLFFAAFLVSQSADAQGCVAIRSFSGCGGVAGSSAFLNQGDIMLGTNFRYFRSFRHFRGTHEETNRVEEGTEVINKSAFLDFTLNYGINNRLYANLTLPFVFHHRTSMYEHGGNPPNGLGERHATAAQGLSDMRIGLGYWLFNPHEVIDFNYALGLGIKIPTGNYEARDVFYNQGPNRNQERLAAVDQSIQPGDGGFGISMDLQGFHIISDRFSINTTLYYLAGLREYVEVQGRNGPSTYSCPDQYLARLGASYVTSVNGLSVYFGGRIEGVPSSDIVGKDSGFRRPGYALSLEPGINYITRDFSLNFSVPFAVKRARVQSYSDKIATEETGMFRNGDAAFADYLINFGLSYRIHNQSSSGMNIMDEH